MARVMRSPVGGWSLMVLGCVLLAAMVALAPGTGGGRIQDWRFARRLHVTRIGNAR